MSLHLDFEPHSWYMGFAIKDDRNDISENEPWTAYTENGNFYFVDTIGGGVLAELKQRIQLYHLKAHNGYGERIAKRRLEQIRREILAERVSLGELAELEALAGYIQPGDTLLLEWAGVPE